LLFTHKKSIKNYFRKFSFYINDKDFKKINLIKYSILPKASNIPSSDYCIILQDYLLDVLIKIDNKITGKIIGSVHINYELVEKTLEKDNYQHDMLRIAKKINVPRFAVSKDVFLAARKNKVSVDRVIYNGVLQANNSNHSNILLQKNQSLKVLFFVSKRPEKGIENVIYTVKKLKFFFKKSNIKISSIGDLDLTYKNYFDTNYGFLKDSDYYKILSSYNIFVYLSLIDGFPAPPLEALCNGCALITTNVSGVTEWAKNNFNCILLNKDDREEMVNKLQDLILNKNLISTLSFNGLESSKQFSWKKNAKDLEDYIYSLNK